MTEICHNFDGVVVLQNCMHILKSEPGPCTGTGQMSSNDGNQYAAKNVEGFTAIKVEEDPGPATSTGIKTELAVSCVPATSVGINSEPTVSCMSVYTGLCTLDQNEGGEWSASRPGRFTQG
jgi:hypothetical protein